MTRPGPLGRRRAPSSSSTSSSSTMGGGGIRRSGISAPGPSSDGWITKHRQLNPGVYEIGASPVAAGGLAVSGAASRVSSQPSKRIEQLAPELEKIISTSEPIRDLADGFGGPHGPAEGPLWWREGRYLLFSDIHNNKRMK